MGRKVHPYGFRLGIIKPWRARWYAEGKEYGELLLEDIALRKMVSKEAAAAGIAEVTIERFPRQVNVTIHAAKPGIIIGRKGAAVNLMRDEVKKFTGKTAKVDVVEIRQPDANAMVIAQSVAGQLERRISHKRAMKQAATKAMRAGAKGVKIVCSGRLGGSDMSRTDQVLQGRVPRQTLRADIDYARFEAVTTFSVIGVKVWIYKGEVLPGDERLNPEIQEQSN
ncbi:MAG: 30S ribosomal protein S3 [Anaerolineae bacterium]|nr:30S ribosomal protein S3 [Ardenticatenia bacterium]MBK8539469.1 30S ribosomal protein S3 [Ardenticatenia bacterium]HQZ71349.1 30S ribosomal protein S3 [Anaerolineae bacterium]HRA21343.1 30S ribosomal protein S3 [Anaerolineae bacterium]